MVTPFELELGLGAREWSSSFSTDLGTNLSLLMCKVFVHDTIVIYVPPLLFLRSTFIILFYDSHCVLTAKRIAAGQRCGRP